MYNLWFTKDGKRKLLVAEVGECQPPDREAGISWYSILIWNDKFQGEVIYSGESGQLMQWNRLSQISDISVGEVSKRQLGKLIEESRRKYRLLTERKSCLRDEEVIKLADVAVEELFPQKELASCGAILSQALRDEEIPW